VVKVVVDKTECLVFKKTYFKTEIAPPRLFKGKSGVEKSLLCSIMSRISDLTDCTEKILSV
jgi:hypothetical protein